MLALLMASGGLWSQMVAVQGAFISPSQTILVSRASGIFPAKSDRKVTGHAQYTFPQTLLWSALGPTGNQKVLPHHLRGLGWGRGTGPKLAI